MKISLALLLSLGGTVALGQNMTMPIINKSAPGSPIESVGTITMTEKIANGSSHDSKVYDLTARNVSDKPILMFVEKLLIVYPSGFGETVIKQKDSFFGPRLVEPGDTVDLGQKDNGGELVFEQKGSSTKQPVCEVGLMYVQFADGTIFGDETYGMQMLGIRQDIWNALAHLNYIYQTEGERAFVEELQRPVQGSEVNSFLDMFRMGQKQKGTQRALEIIRGELKRAEDRQADMSTVTQPKGASSDIIPR